MPTSALKKDTVATGAAPADALMTQQAAISTGAPEHSGSHTKPHLTPPETPTYTPLEADSELAATAATPQHIACMPADVRPQSGFAAQVSKAINFFAQHGSEDGDSAHTICVVNAGMHGSPEHSDPSTPTFMPNEDFNDGLCMPLMHIKGTQKIEDLKDRKEESRGLVEITKEKSIHVSHASVPHVEASMFTTYSSSDNVGSWTQFAQDITRSITPSVEKTTGALTSSEDSNLSSPFAGVNLAVKNDDDSAAESSLFGSAMSSISVSATSAQDDQEVASGAISVDDLPRNSLVFAWMNPPTEVQRGLPLDGSHSNDALGAVGILDDNPQGESQSGTDRGCGSITIEGKVRSSYPEPNPSTTSLLSQHNTVATSASGEHSNGISNSTGAIVSALCHNSCALVQPAIEGEVSSTKAIAKISTAQPILDVKASERKAGTEQGSHAKSCMAPADLPGCDGAAMDGSMEIVNSRCAGTSADSRVIENAGSAASIEGAYAGSAAATVIADAGIVGASGSAAGGSVSRLLCNNRDSELSVTEVRTQTQQITSPAQPPSTPAKDCTSLAPPSMDVVTPPALPPIRTTQATPEIMSASPTRRSQDSTHSIHCHQYPQKLLPTKRSLCSVINDACHAACIAESGASSASHLQTHNMRPYSFMEALQWINQIVDALHKLHTASPQVLHGGLTPESLVLCSSQGSGLNIEIKGFGPDYIPHSSGSADFEKLMLSENRRQNNARQQLNSLSVGGKRSLEAVEATGWDTVSLDKHKLLYRAPEVLTGAECDAKGDIFSLGVIMYELFTMRPLATTACIGNKHATVGTYLSRVHGGHREALDASWPQGLRQTIGMCWHDCPEIRPTASQLRDLLDTLEPSIVQMDARFGGSSSRQVSGVGAVKQSTKRESRFKLPWKRSKA